ncbi:hypothetical protein JTB14_033207 [Gonioctena quinquepunctata]|nr:hypothetical protein JTB14_033207 [Gonioctena quinquepunctata]
MFFPKEEGAFTSKITIKCTCGAVFESSIKCVANYSKLLSYGFYLGDTIDEDNTSFPFFPDENSSKAYFDGMNKVVDVVEKWLYYQGFFYKDFLRIPDTIATYPFDFYREKNDKADREKKKCSYLPLVQLLVNMIDESVLKCLIDKKSSPSLDDLKGTIYDYGVYKNVMDFLQINGIFVQQLKPEYLLTFERYVIFKNRLVDKNYDSAPYDDILTEEKFHLLSKQCWVDLILNIYKVFIFDRTLQDKIGAPEMESSVVFENEFSKYFSENIDNCKYRNKNEAKLLLWLEFHFANQKNSIWPDKNIEPRKMRSLNKAVEDGLPFLTLMAAYCPYIIEYLKDSYENASATASLLLHNCCVTNDSWRKLNLSYFMKPRSVLEPVTIELRMLLTYLYGVLPNFYPSDTIEIRSPLGQSASKEMELKNCGEVLISYSVSMFLNDSGEFQTSHQTIVIPPKKVKKIKISYTAKSFLESKAILVLSGETIGYRFAKSKAVNLCGIPDIFNITHEYSLTTEMYKPITQYLEIKSPYGRSYIADTYFYLRRGDLLPSGTNEFVAVSSMIKDKVPRQICIEDKCHFDEAGKYRMTLGLCFVTSGLNENYIYFLSKEVGVFCIKLIITSKLADKTFSSLNVRLPNFHASEACACKKGILNNLCPRVVRLEIPCRNYFLLKGLKNMIRAYAEQNEYDFWIEHLVFPKGFRILGSYLRNTFDDRLVSFNNVLEPTVSFKTIVTGKKYSIEKSILIKDVTSDSGTKVLIHWDSAEFPQEEILVLNATHGQEKRRYKLIFQAK